MDIDLLKSLIGFIQFLWFAFIALLVAAAIMLLIGSKKRYLIGIVALSLPAAVSLCWILAVGVVDSLVTERIASQMGPWVTLIIPHLIESSPGAWATLLLSSGGLAGLFVLRRRSKKKAATDNDSTTPSDHSTCNDDNLVDTELPSSTKQDECSVETESTLKNDEKSPDTGAQATN